MYKGRFAPSPTGDLHVGSAASALLGWLFARSAGGTFALRVEDIDTPRVRAGMEQRQLDDLVWLGIDWDEGPGVGGAHGPYRQSERTSLYDRALADLAAQGLTYYCDCSRTEIARVASAPHAGEEGPRYPGTCRELGMKERDFKRPPAVRLKVPSRPIILDDRLQGRLIENVDATVGDFVLRRGDGVYAYQLAVVVDDLAMEITEVVRGADLLASAARQALLAELLGKKPPAFAHHAMVVAADGTRLAKRANGVSLRSLREAGVAPETLVGVLADAFALRADTGAGRVAARDLAGVFDGTRLVGRTEVRIGDGAILPR
jgi:glutamyl-tRNA synthetase